MSGFQRKPFPPRAPKTVTIKATSFPGFLLGTAPVGLLNPTLEGSLLRDRHLALHLEQMTGAELGMKRPDELQAFEEHLDGSVLDLPIGIIEQRPIELRVKPTAIRGNLLFWELARFAQPTVCIAVETTPIQEGVDVDRFPCQQNAVLLKTALKLEVLLLSSGQGIDAGR